MKNMIAVISGDIIKSSNLKQRNKLPAVLRGCYKYIISKFPDESAYEIDVFSGDSWQFALRDIQSSLRVALAFKTYLKSGKYMFPVDARISLAIGDSTFISKKKISESDGEAFRASGRNLLAMDKNQTLAFYCKGCDRLEELSLLLTLIDSILSKYTSKQALAVFGALTYLNQSEIAKLWKPRITQQSVNKHLKSASWNAIEKAVLYFEKYFTTTAEYSCK